MPIINFQGASRGTDLVGLPRNIVGGVFGASTATVFSIPTGATKIGNYAMQGAFRNWQNLTTIDMSTITEVESGGCDSFCYECSSLTSIDLSSLTTAKGTSFQYAFRGNSIASVTFSALDSIGWNSVFYMAFKGNTRVTSVSFPALKSSSFGSYVNQLDGFFSQTGTNVTHTIHFPSNLQTVVQGLTGYPNFGGTSGYVTLAFDLPATS